MVGIIKTLGNRSRGLGGCEMLQRIVSSKEKKHVRRKRKVYPSAFTRRPTTCLDVSVEKAKGTAKAGPYISKGGTKGVRATKRSWRLAY